jgi:TatD DNase family protein
MLVDSHCHLDFPDFAADFDAVLARAHDAGVGTMLTICTHLSRAAGVLAVAEHSEALWCTVGVHPHEAASEDLRAPNTLIDAARHPKVVGFGETGLDFYYQHSPRAAQERSFRLHLAAARTAGLPVVIHSRDADSETAAILEDEIAAGPIAGVIHCFSGSPELARRAIALGLYISFSGILSFPKASALRELAATLPLERLLVETDAPFLAPVPVRGRRNEPAFVAHTAACLAQALGRPAAEVAQATTENFFRLFGKAERRCASPS